MRIWSKLVSDFLEDTTDFLEGILYYWFKPLGSHLCIRWSAGGGHHKCPEGYMKVYVLILSNDLYCSRIKSYITDEIKNIMQIS